MKIELSRHAVERFHERVRPTLTQEQAEGELRRLTLMCEVSVERPSFVLEERREEGPADAFMVVSPGVALPLQRIQGGKWLAVTCLSHMGLSEETRRRRQLRMLGIGETGARLHPELAER